MPRHKYLWLVVALVAVIVAVVFAPLNKWIKNQESTCLQEGDLLFTRDDLSRYDGQDSSPGLYLAFLGLVYDVSKGSKHYGPGGSYAIFSGKDATRAFITGNFNQEELRDDVDDLPVDSFTGLKEWEQFYQKEYSRKGKLIGNYYDMNGCPTKSMNHVLEMYSKLEQLEKDKADDEVIYPPCNSEWHQDSGRTRFWCTERSGGVQRDWIGFPRQMIPVDGPPKCVCVQNDPSIVYDDEDHILKEYKGCDPASTECILHETKRDDNDEHGTKSEPKEN